MMYLNDWLRLIGFHGHPFALKKADEEGDQLGEYFVAHPSYNRILDADRSASSILHAPRGAGKSSTRRMFERYCRDELEQQRPLLVRLTDWMPLVRRVGVHVVVPPEQHFTELAHRLVVSLAQDDGAGLRSPILSPHTASYLSWLCITYGGYLTLAERERLAARGWLASLSSGVAPALEGLPVARQIQLLGDLIEALDYSRCYLLVDGVDEVLETAASWAAGANLVEGLLANLALIETPKLAFKMFLPSEVVAVLGNRGRLRPDRLKIFALVWDHELLLEVLQRRLAAFNDSRIGSLAQLAEPALRTTIDAELVTAASGSPRMLLNLGDWLFEICAREATAESLLIRKEHLEAALARLPDAPQLIAVAEAPPVPAEIAAAVVDEPALPAVPALRLKPNGEIWLGDALFDDWVKLTPMQRRLLQFLYDNRDRLCSKEEIIAYVWAGRDRPADDDSLRKLMDRVIDLIEQDPNNLRYFHKVPGYVRLVNTVG